MLHRTQIFFSLLLLALSPAGSLAADDEPAHHADMTERLRACAACHGERGRSRSEVYFPSIAGKPAGYLGSQLENFREGRRRHAIMESMLAYLSDDYLEEMAVYYSRQEPAWTPPSHSRSEAELERGRQLVEYGDPALDVPSCKACHGASLKGVAPSIPGLLGLRPEYLSAQLGAWRTGVRQAEEPDCMATIAKRLTRADLAAVTAWIASRSYPSDHTPEPSLKRELPLACGNVQ